MPIYADQLLRGRGKFRCRVVIEGWPYIFVDDRSLARTRTDGREQIVGLIPTSLRFSARADLARAELRAQEMTLELRDTRRGLITRALHTTPASTTWLTADVSVTDTTIHVADTSSFAGSGVVHIGTEAIAYSGKTATSFTGCARAHWQSVAQAHTLGDGESVWYPRVTDTPRSLVGRRVLFYLYGSGDPGDSEGTLRWRGVTRGGVEYREGVYTLAVDPITRILEQQLGADLSDEVGIRGIYFPSKAALVAEFSIRAGATPSSSRIGSHLVQVSGFFATQDDLVDEINSQLSTAAWPVGASMVCAKTARGYRFAYTTGSSPHFVRVIGSEVKPRSPFSPGPWPYGISPSDLFVRSDGNEGRWRVSGGDVVRPGEPMASFTTYEMDIDAPFPRHVAHLYGSWFEDPFDTSNPVGRLYLSGGITPTVGSRVTVKVNEDHEPTGTKEVYSASSVDRSIDLSDPWLSESPLTAEAAVKFFRDLASGHVGDLIDRLIADSPALASGGAMPLLTSDDFRQEWSEVEDAVATLPLGRNRSFVVSDGVSLGELLAEELKLIGCYLALDTSGRMQIRRLRLATATDGATATLGSRQIKGQFPGVSDSASGILGSVMIKHGYSVEEGDHEGRPVLVRNTTSPTTLAGTLQIAPLSRRTDVPVGTPEITVEDAYQIASAVLGLYGESYEVITLGLGLESSGLAHGDTVLLTTPHVPGARGTMGVAQQPAQVLGYDWSPFEGRGAVDLLLHHRRVAGYSPGFPVTAWTHRGGNVWALDLEVAGYAPGSTTASDWLGVGDRVRIIEDGSRAPDRLAATVVSVGALEVGVEFAGAWNPGSKKWRIGYRSAPDVSVTPSPGRRWTQKDFAFVSDQRRRVGFSDGDIDAVEFSP